MRPAVGKRSAGTSWAAAPPTLPEAFDGLDLDTPTPRSPQQHERAPYIPVQHVALLDRDGVVVGVNRAWRQFGLANGGSATTGLGSNYLEVCESAAAHGSPGSREAADIVRAALTGDEPARTFTYPCGGPGLAAGSGADDERVRWFCLRAIPLPGRHRGAIVVHLDVTVERPHDRKRPPHTV